LPFIYHVVLTCIMGENRNASRALIGKPERKCLKEKLDVDAKTVLRYIERNRMSRVWAEFMCVFVCMCVCEDMENWQLL
jgi:hypothetical protein